MWAALGRLGAAPAPLLRLLPRALPAGVSPCRVSFRPEEGSGARGCCFCVSPGLGPAGASRAELWGAAAAGAFTIPHVTMATQVFKEQGERIKCVKGDLFSCPQTDALAHCISEDCRMGAGIAVLFKKKFGGVQELLDQQKKTGEVAVLQRDDRYIYYLITKKKVSHKPTYEDMRKSLEAMKTHCLNNGVTDISMPKIGCGLDRLDWDKVSAILGEVFEDTDIKITVYTL